MSASSSPLQRTAPVVCSGKNVKPMKPKATSSCSARVAGCYSAMPSTHEQGALKVHCVALRGDAQPAFLTRSLSNGGRRRMLEAPAQAWPVIESLHVKLIGKRYYYYLILSHASTQWHAWISDSLELHIYNKTNLDSYLFIHNLQHK